jgi:hypothetical protein
VISFKSISSYKALRKVPVICLAPYSDRWQWFSKMWAGLDNFDTFVSGVDQLFIAAIELTATRGGLKACFILKVKHIYLADAGNIDLADAGIGSFILLIAFWSFLHDGSRIKTSLCGDLCLGVDVQHHCFHEETYGGQNGVQMA